ncbi:MAG: hypothetical protein ACKN9D_17045, partial [Actinomycetales bacterium]
ITPRFAITSSPAQLEAAGSLAREFPDVAIQTILATLTPPALDAIGQARPGDLVRLRVLRHRTMTSMQ